MFLGSPRWVWTVVVNLQIARRNMAPTDRFWSASSRARLRDKTIRLSIQLLLASVSTLALNHPAFAGSALPTGGQYVAGQGTIKGGTNSLTINQNSGKGIIDWQGFSIGSGNAVFFNNGSGSTLNRVTGGDLSKIDGQLHATGSVYLINPQGIVIGPGGKVVTNGSFVASTRDISDSNFLGSGALTLSGNSAGNVVNAGTITSKTGDAILVGRSVSNSGTISASNGTAGLAAGNQVILQPVSGDPRIAISGGSGAVTNTGTVKAAQAELTAAGGDVYDLAKNRGGLVSATGTATIGGHVWLTAGGTATVGGTVAAQNADGSGGAVTVRAQNIAQSGSVDASAGAAGATGGNVSIVASDTATIGGTISAKGGDGGTGGFVETSGLHLHVLDAARILTNAFSGIDGRWLIDPADFTIAASGGDITGTALAANLANTDVTIESSAGTVNTSGSGDVNVNDGVTWTSGHSLTLDAYRNVNINASLTSGGSAPVTLHADATGMGTGTVTFSGGAKVITAGAITIFYDPTGDSTTVNGTKYTAATQTDFSGNVIGSTPVSYMLVNTVTDLQNVQNNLSARYALGRDIDASGTASWNSGQGFKPIGSETTPFSGVFDGQSHAIGGLTIDRPTGTQEVGLFGGLDGGALVENLALTNVQITGGSVTGGLVGLQLSGTISGVSVTGSVTGNNSAEIGGIAGVEIGAITSSFTDVTVSSTGTGSRVGGLVGLANGLIGGSQSITSSYSLSSVTGDNAGGLVGFSLSFPLSISNSYAAGAVVGHTASGGLVGNNNTQVTFSNSYWDVGTTGQSSAVAPGSTGQTMGTATGESTAQLQGSLPGGFGSSTWGTGTGLYPYLKSFFPTGVEAISGTAYTDAGVHVATGGMVDLDSGGALLGQGAIGANGYYYVALAAGSVANGANLLVSVPTTGSAAVNGALLASSTYAGANTIQTGVDLYGGFLSEATSATTLSGAPSLASFQSAANTVAGTDTTATGVIAAIANPGYLASGSSFAVDQTVNGTGLLVITGAGDPITVSNAITIASGGSLGLISGGALAIDTPIKAEGAASVALGFDGSNPTNLSFGLTSAGFLGSLSFTNADGSAATASQGGSLAIDGASYALLYSLNDLDGINTAGGLVGDYALAANLDASATSNWAPIGTTSAGGAINNGFAGNFTGLGHTVLNLTANLGSRHYVGLFGYASGTLRDIGVVGGSVSGSDQIGDLVGGTDGAIVDAYATGAVHGGSGGSGNNAGGLAGYAGLVADSYATGNVSGDNGVGGLLGTAGGPVTNAYATGAVSGNTYVAGLVAYGDVVTIDNVYATGAVSGGSNVGALVAGGSGTTITHAYATGAVSSGGAGLLANSSSGNSVANSYWDTQTTGTSASAGGGTAQTTAQLQGTLPGTFDSSVWGTGTGLYPYLKSFFPNGVEAVSGTAYKDAGVTVAASGSSGAVTVNLDAGGALLGQATTGANGYYYIALQAGAVANGGNLLVSTPTAGSIALNAATLAVSTYAGANTIQTGVKLYGGFLAEPTSATALASAPSLASFQGAANTVAGTDTAATGAVAAIANPGYLATGLGFAINQSYSGSGLLVTTGSGHPIIVSNAVTIASGGSLGLFSGGALNIDAPVKAEGATAVAFQYDASDPTNLSFGLTPTGFLGSLDFTNADGSAATSSQGGSLVVEGTSYALLYSMSDLAGINATATALQGNYALAGSLDASGTSNWTPLGSDGLGNVLNNGLGFNGSFTGLGHVIAKLTVDTGSNGLSGLFGITSGTLRDIGLAGGSVKGGTYVGGLVGSASGGTIADAYAAQSVNGTSLVGGLVGYNADVITDAYATGAVSGGSEVGGLAGINFGLVTKAFATGTVSGGTDVGGLIGDNAGQIANAFATGAVSGSSFVGGLYGRRQIGLSVTAVYATGTVSSSGNVGGLTGDNSFSIDNGYWDTQTSGTSFSSLGTGKTTAQLQGTLPTGFFSSTWGTGAGLYPFLTIFFPHGVQAVSGTAYKDAGANVAASGAGGAVTVNLDAGGSLLAQATTGANGYYYFALSAGSVANGSNLLVSTPTAGSIALNAATLAASTYPGANTIQTGVNLYGGFLSETTSATALSGVPGLASVQSAANTMAGTDTTATGVIAGLAHPGYLTTGASFTVDQDYNGSGFLVATGAGAPITVSNAVTITDGGSLALLSGGALAIDAPIKAEGATSVALVYDASNPANLSFGLTAAGFAGSLSFTKADGSAATSSQGGSLAIDGAAYTLLYSMSDVAGINASDAALQGNYALAGSLDASSVTGWIPLGTDGASNVLNGISGFSGGFTGLGHTIANLTVDIGSNTYAGLFGYASGVLRDIGLTGSAVTGRVDVGALAGYSHGQVADAYAIGTVGSDGIVGGLVGENWGTITGAYAIGTVNGGVNAGGLVGVNNSGSIADAYAAGTVTGTGTLGGLVGGNSSGTITNAYATATVSGDNSIGGLVGSNSRGSITNAYATGAVSGDNSIGGLVGFDNRGSITHAYATGAVSGNGAFGGLVGMNDSGVVTDAYWDTQTGGMATSAAGTGRTTAQLQGTLPGAFDGTVWGTGTGLYPYLQSFFPNGVQAVSGTAYKDAGVNVAASGSSGAVTVNLDAGGALLGQATTGANGYYYIALQAGAVANGSNLLVAVPTDAGAVNAATLAVSTYSAGTPAQTGVDLYGGFLAEPTNATVLSGAPSLANFQSAANTVAGTDATATGVIAGVAHPGYLTTGAGFTIDQSYSGSGLLVATAAGDPIIVSNAITIASGGSLGLLSSGALAIDAPIKAEGASSVALVYDASDPANLSFDLTSAGFIGSLSFTNADGSAATASQGGSLAVNGAAYTLLYSMIGLQGINTDSSLQGNYALAANLDDANAGLTALGTDGAGGIKNSGNGFSGSFTGLGHTIANILVDPGVHDYSGLFGYATGPIRDIGVVGGRVFGDSDIGGLVGWSDSSVSDAYATDTVSGLSGDSAVGGLVGYASHDGITDAFATGAVSGSLAVGGLVGYAYGSVITDAYATGAVTAGISGTAADMGGLVGHADGTTITDAYATGMVAGSSNNGGIVGAADSSTLTNVFATGAVVDAGGFVGGGLVGENNGTTVAGYWDAQTSGKSASAGDGTGLTTAQLQGTLPGGFDSAVWGTGPGLYPYLKTFFPNGVEAISGTAYKDAGVHPAATGQSGAVTLNLDVGGALLTQATTGANGYYYVALQAGAIANGGNLLVSVPTGFSTGAVNAGTLVASTYAGADTIQTGVNLYGGFLSEETGATTLSGAPSLASFQSAANTVAGTDFFAAGVIGAIAHPGYLATGSFTVDQSFSGTGLLIATGAGDTLTVSHAVTITSGGTLGLFSGGALAIDAPVTAEGAVAVGLGYDGGDLENLSFGLTSAGFTGSLGFTNADGSAATSSQGGSLAVDGTLFTLLYSMNDVAEINANDTALQGDYALAGSLDATSTTGWVPLGTDGHGNARNSPFGFSGSFTGLGHTIANLTVDIQGNTYAGLFGLANGSVRDIGVVGGSVHGGSEVGALAGAGLLIADAYATAAVSGDSNVGGLAGAGGLIVNAYATGAVSGSYAVGGLVGTEVEAIVDAYATGAVSGGDRVGGLVGTTIAAPITITNSFATGAVSGDTDVGGLVGYADWNNSITDAYAMGAVRGSSDVGGLVGHSGLDSFARVYATGAVSGSTAVGGLIGSDSASAITDAYWDTQTSGTFSSAAGTGLTTAQLQGTTLTDFDPSVWGTGPGLYPYLNSFFPNGVQAISGTAYSDAGVTPLASGAAGAIIVSALANGAALGSATTGANGYYYILLPAGTLTGTQQLLAYLAGGTVKANTYVAAASGNVDADLYGGWLRMLSGAGSTSAMFAGLGTALGGNTGSDFLYGGGALASGTSLGIVSGSGFVIDDALDLGSSTISLNAAGPVTQTAAVTAGSLELLGASASYTLTDGDNAIGTLAADTGSVSLVNDGDLAVGAVDATTGVASSGNVDLAASGNLTIASGALVSWGGGGTSVLSAGGNFVNDEGSDAVTATHGGRWLIYSDTPGDDTFGALDSGNRAIWNAAGLAPGSVTQTGNRYLFAYRPTLTVTTTDVGKTYGDDATAAVAAAYSIGGLQPAQTGAYLADTAADVYSGAPSVTSTGSAVTAGVSSSPYAIAATAGTLSVGDGYALAFANTGNLTVAARPITVTADDLSRIYGDANPALTYTVGGGGLVNGDALSGGLTTGATTTSNVGGYGITQGTLAASNNYDVTYVAGTLTVTARPLTVTADDLSRIYGDANPALTYTLGGDGLVNGDALSGGLTTSATTASNVGGYGITQGSLAASNNYDLTYVAGTLTVTARPLTVTADDLSRIYGDANPALTYTLGGDGLVNGDALSGALATSATTASNVGGYGITQGSLAASNNYDLTYVAGTLTVAARPLTVTADDLSRIYGDANPALTYTLGGDGLVNGDALSGGLTTGATTASNVGGYGITQGTLAASNNYDLTYVAGTLTVTARALTVTADDLSRIYGDANPALTYTLGGAGLVNGDALSGALTTGATTASNVGGYGITQGTLAASNNYDVTYVAGTLTVTARPLTVTADDLSRIYGDANPALTYTVGGLVNGDALSGGLTTSATTASNVGAYGIAKGSLAASPNYDLTYVAGALTVTARPLTVAADDQSRFVGQNNPPLTYRLTAGTLVNGDSLGGAPATTAGLSSNPGAYAITQGTLAASSNYALAFVPGTLTVEAVSPRPLFFDIPDGGGAQAYVLGTPRSDWFFSGTWPSDDLDTDDVPALLGTDIFIVTPDSFGWFDVSGTGNGWLFFQLGPPGQLTPFHPVKSNGKSAALPAATRFAMK